MTLIKAGHVVLTGDRATLPGQRSASRNRLEHAQTTASDNPASDVALRDDAIAKERNALQARVTELEATLADHRARLDAQIADAFERGADSAREQFVRSESERVETLRSGVDGALSALAERLDSLHTPATEIALTALERVLGDPTDYADLVIATVRHRLTLLSEGSVLTIRVSAIDFPDAPALERIKTASHVELVADPSLREGACVIDLQLGTIDAGIAQQHARIASLLKAGHGND